MIRKTIEEILKILTISNEDTPESVKFKSDLYEYVRQLEKSYSKDSN